jgi:hypothetical protein
VLTAFAIEASETPSQRSSTLEEAEPVLMTMDYITCYHRFVLRAADLTHV